MQSNVESLPLSPEDEARRHVSESTAALDKLRMKRDGLVNRRDEAASSIQGLTQQISERALRAIDDAGVRRVVKGLQDQKNKLADEQEVLALAVVQLEPDIAKAEAALNEAMRAQTDASIDRLIEERVEAAAKIDKYLGPLRELMAEYRRSGYALAAAVGDQSRVIVGTHRLTAAIELSLEHKPVQSGMRNLFERYGGTLASNEAHTLRERVTLYRNQQRRALGLPPLDGTGEISEEV